MSETPRLRWFEQYPACSCGAKAAGILRGEQNESYGPHCQKCAKRRLRSSEIVRKATLKRAEPQPERDPDDTGRLG